MDDPDLLDLPVPPPTDYTPGTRPALKCNLWDDMSKSKGFKEWGIYVDTVISCNLWGEGQVDREDPDHPSLTQVSSANPKIVRSCATLWPGAPFTNMV